MGLKNLVLWWLVSLCKVLFWESVQVLKDTHCVRSYDGINFEQLSAMPTPFSGMSLRLILKDKH